MRTEGENMVDELPLLKSYTYQSGVFQGHTTSYRGDMIGIQVFLDGPFQGEEDVLTEPPGKKFLFIGTDQSITEQGCYLLSEVKPGNTVAETRYEYRLDRTWEPPRPTEEKAP